jgi:hypothetical protein
MMTFAFEDVTDTTAEVVLSWDDVRVPFTLEVPAAPAAETE